LLHVQRPVLLSSESDHELSIGFIDGSKLAACLVFIEETFPDRGAAR
jgi:hypothetical protein